MPMKSKSPKTSKVPILTEIAGSDKKPLAGAKLVGKIDPDERIEVTLRVRRCPATAEAKEATSAVGEPLSREQFSQLLGADPADIARIEDFAHDHGFEVLQASIPQRMVRLAGPASAVKAAFGTTLKRMVLGKTRFRGRTGSISVPKDVHALIEGVFGLDDRPQAKPHFRPQAVSKKKVRLHAGGGANPLTPVQVAKIYSFPSGLNGSGQTIAIIELGGGYRSTDLQKYFASLGLATPKVTAVSVSGGHNLPTGKPDGPDGEVMLDIEVAGAVAPGARIAVYFAPNTDAGFLNALTAAVHDNLRKPCVVSISWGAAESDWTAQATSGFDSACSDAALLGITVCVAAGDHGTTDSDDTSVTRANADFPASSPHVLACGGTRLETANGAITSETVWNNHDGWATGGGVSEVFPVPAFQSGANIPNSINKGGKKGRGVPDVAGDADGDTGYKVRVDGVNTVIGGTSAVAPLWAGLIAVLTQGKGGSLGFMTPRLYKLPAASQALRDIVAGDNNGYHAGAGWDACTGLGVPNGAKLLSAF
jgi:kumamolisin